MRKLWLYVKSAVQRGAKGTVDQLKRKLCFCDIIVIFLASVLVLSAFSYQVFGHRSGESCTVRTETDEFTLDLSEDKEATLVSCGISLTIIVKDGEAWVDASSCPDKICVHSGKISKSGQSVVCIPAKASLTISTEADDADWIIG